VDCVIDAIMAGLQTPVHLPLGGLIDLVLVTFLVTASSLAVLWLWAEDRRNHEALRRREEKDRSWMVAA
jgi:hypothetical protein